MNPNLTQYWSHIASVARDSARRVGAIFAGLEINSLLEGGEEEFDYVELKSTLRWCVKEGSKKEQLQDSVVKAVAGFLNAKRGSVFIGIEDTKPTKTTIGIEADWNTFSNECNRNKDGFDRHLRQLLGNKLRPLPCLPINIEYPPLHGHQVCRIVVAPAKEPVFIGKNQGEKLYVRDGRRTVELKGEHCVGYIKRRWPDFAPVR